MFLLARNLSKIHNEATLPKVFQEKKSSNFKNIHSSPSTLAAKSEETRVKCTLIPGDGVGPELVQSVQELFKAAQVPVDFETIFFSELDPAKSAPLESVIQSVKKNRVCLKGITGYSLHSDTGELETLNMKLRKALDLFANVVHIKSMPGVETRHKNVDCIVVREHLEGEYSALEHESVKGMVEGLKIVTAKQSVRIAKFAFDYAMRHQRKKVTAVHKAQIMKLGDGLFLRKCEEMSKLYPKIKFEKINIDHCFMEMVHEPQQFDMLITMNLYGSLIENLGAGLIGGAGILPGASYSPNYAVFEPGARHIFIEGVGKNVANPSAMFLSAANLLKHVNLPLHSKMIVRSVESVLKEGKVRTRDLGGQSSTLDFTSAVIKNLKMP